MKKIPHFKVYMCYIRKLPFFSIYVRQADYDVMLSQQRLTIFRFPQRELPPGETVRCWLSGILGLKVCSYYVSLLSCPNNFLIIMLGCMRLRFRCKFNIVLNCVTVIKFTINYDEFESLVNLKLICSKGIRSCPRVQAPAK